MRKKSDGPGGLGRSRVSSAPSAGELDRQKRKLASQPRILVIDNEPGIHRVLRPALNSCGYETITATTGEKALGLIASTAPDAVFLDLDLPDVEGHALLRQIRSSSDMPIIILSARKQEFDKIAAFESGADDYIEKPFAIGELIARLRTALRHARNNPESHCINITAAGLTVDLAKRGVSRNGVPIRLTPKEFDLLAIFARNAGYLLTHRDILTAVWGASHENDIRLLRVFIAQLRGKIEEDPTNPTVIQTEKGAGYRFTQITGR